MASTYIAERFVQASVLHDEAQRAASGVAVFRPLLATNSELVLAADVWADLYDGHPALDVDALCALTGRTLTDEQLDAIIAKAAKEKAKVVSAAVAHNDIDAGRLGKLLGTKHAKSVAKAASGTGEASGRTIPEEHLGKIAYLLGGTHLAEYLATHPGEIDDEAASQLLATFETWKGPKLSKRRRHSLQFIIELRPALLGAFVTPTSDIALVSAAAGHRFLTDEALQHQLVRNAAEVPDDADDDLKKSIMYAVLALANNPVAHKSTVELIAELGTGAWSTPGQSARTRLAKFSEVPTVTCDYADIDNAGVLAWLIRRSIPRVAPDGHLIAGKPLDVAALCANANLNLDQARRLLEALGNYDIGDVLGDARIEDCADKLIALHPGLDRPSDRYQDPGPYPSNYSGSGTAPDWATRTVACLANSVEARQWLIERLPTSAQWRIVLAVVDGSEAQTLEDFAITVEAVA